jgi:hypothetical protein
MIEKERKEMKAQNLEFWCLNPPIEGLIRCSQNGCRNHSVKRPFEIKTSGPLKLGKLEIGSLFLVNIL